MAQWIECQPSNWKVASSIPSQGTCLGCGPGPQLGAWERQWVSLAHWCLSPALSPSLPKESERNINVWGKHRWLPLTCTPTRDRPTTAACGLTMDQWPFSLRDEVQPTKPHRPELSDLFSTTPQFEPLALVGFILSIWFVYASALQSLYLTFLLPFANVLSSEFNVLHCLSRPPQLSLLSRKL